MNEGDLLDGLLELGDTIHNAESYRKIRIKRNGKLKIEFRLRPLLESESRLCVKKATPLKRKGGKDPETDIALYRSLLIYTATVDEDRKKLWDNPKATNHYNVINGYDIIDKVLLAGEKQQIIDVLDEISLADGDIEDDAKN